MIMKITEQQMSNLRSTLFQALGHASVCWESAPNGVFDSTQALDVGEVLLSDIVKILELEVDRS